MAFAPRARKLSLSLCLCPECSSNLFLLCLHVFAAREQRNHSAEEQHYYAKYSKGRPARCRIGRGIERGAYHAGEFAEYIKEHINDQWIPKVLALKTRMQRGKEIAEQINILGDDGVPVDYHIVFWKSEILDYVILQQDAFDEVDAVTPLERQEEILNLVTDICEHEYSFADFLEVVSYLKKMINLCKQMNYSPYKSEQYYSFKQQVQDMVAQAAQ